MLERAAILGGTVDVRSRVGVGTRVDIVIPFTRSDRPPTVAARPALDVAR